MSAATTAAAGPSIADLAYIYTSQLGLKLVPLPPRSKRPLTDDWGNNLLEDPEQARDHFQRNPRANMGVALGPSGVCSLDIDDAPAARLIFEEFGFDLDAMCASHPSIQGQAPGFRILFSIPEGVFLKYHSLTWPSEKDPTGEKYRDLMNKSRKARDAGDNDLADKHKQDAEEFQRFTVFEMRAACDGQQRQDVLPPSIHPDTGMPYVWLRKPRRNEGLLPPPDFLLKIWENWEPLKTQFAAICPWAPKEQRKPAVRQLTRQPGEGASVIDSYNQAHDIEQELLRYGYKAMGRRFLSPHSHTGLAGVNVWQDENKCFIHHASDPLCSTTENRPVAPFDLFCEYEHNGDVRAAVKAAAAELGIPFEPRKPQQHAKTPPPPNIDPETGEILDAPQADNPDQAPAPKPAANDNAESSEGFIGYSPYDFFTVLGYDREEVFIFQHEKKQLLVLNSGSLTTNKLLELAPAEGWEATHPTKTGFDKNAAINEIFRRAHRMPVFNPARIRGRGAWFDDGRHVFHFGDRLVSDGKEHRIGRLRSRYIYQAEVPLEINEQAKALTDDEGENLLYIATKFRWNMPASAALLSGWVALAPLCGALRWRPHIWLTGGAGCGKSTILESYVNRLTNWCNVYAQGNSTEAGIRQTLGCDAMPVLFDESEKNSERERLRIDAVLSLIRQASSESGAKTLKGTTSGSAMNFHIRSMFCLASIQVGIEQQADRERLTVLALKSKPLKGSTEEEQSSKQWQHVKDLLYSIERDDTIHDRLFNRMIGMLPAVLKAIDVFTAAAAKHFGNQRAGDQYGTLMAGCWCLLSRDEPTEHDALEMIEKFDWNEHTETGQLDDAGRALMALLEARIRTASGSEFSVFELVDCIAYASGVERKGRGDDDRPSCHLDQKDAQSALQRNGMKVHQNRLVLSNNSEALVRLVAGTSFQSDFRGLLSRNSGVIKNAGVVWINGAAARCIGIPLDIIV